MDKQQAKYLKIAGEVTGLLLILTLAAVLRFVNLRLRPDWYMDEGYYINIARNLLAGRWQTMAIQGSPLLVGRPPLFIVIVAGAFRLFGADIWTLRAVTVVCGLLNISIVYLIARKILGLGPAMMSALFLAILPQVVFYNRLGVTYDLLTTFFLLFVYALWRYLDGKDTPWMAAAAISAGLAISTDYIGLVAVAVLVGAVFLVQPKKIWVAVILLAIPFATLMLPLIWRVPADVIYDLKYTLFWGAGSAEGSGQIPLIVRFVVIYGDMIHREGWILLGLVGLFILPERRLKIVLSCMIVGTFLVYIPSHPLQGHYLLPVYGLIAISVGYLISWITARLLKIGNAFHRNDQEVMNKKQMLVYRMENLSASTLAAVLVVFTLAAPLIWLFSLDYYFFWTGTEKTPELLLHYYYNPGYAPAGDVMAVAEFLTPKVGPQDLVISSPHITWMLAGNLAAEANMVVYEGGGVSGIKDFSKNRFAFDASMENAKFIVIDNSWRGWYMDSLPDLKQMTAQITRWPLVFSRGSIDVYCNPLRCP